MADSPLPQIPNVLGRVAGKAVDAAKGLASNVTNEIAGELSGRLGWSAFSSFSRPTQPTADPKDSKPTGTTVTNKDLMSGLTQIDGTLNLISKDIKSTNEYMWSSISNQQQTNLLLDKLNGKISELSKSLESSNSSGSNLLDDLSGSGKGKSKPKIKLKNQKPSAKVGALSKLGGMSRVLGPAMLMADGAYEGYSEYQESGNSGRALSSAGGTILGGGLGMWGGAAAGAAVGSVIPGIGTALGGLVGGFAGGMGGSWAGRNAAKSGYDYFTAPIAPKPLSDDGIKKLESLNSKNDKWSAPTLSNDKLDELEKLLAPEKEKQKTGSDSKRIEELKSPLKKSSMNPNEDLTITTREFSVNTKSFKIDGIDLASYIKGSDSGGVRSGIQNASFSPGRQSGSSVGSSSSSGQGLVQGAGVPAGRGDVTSTPNSRPSVYDPSSTSNSSGARDGFKSPGKGTVSGGIGGAGRGVQLPEGKEGQYRPQYKLSDADLSDEVVKTIAGEARVGNKHGVDAVINTMFNRLGSSGYGKSGNLLEIASAPGQFEGFNKGRVSPSQAEEIRNRIKEIASGKIADNTGGANEFRTTSWAKANAGSSPWARKNLASGIDIGGNTFAKNKKSKGKYHSYDLTPEQLAAQNSGDNQEAFGGQNKVKELTQGKTRDLPISNQLKDILNYAAYQSGVDVNVTSGGQSPLGSGGKRTGSTRHDVGFGKMGAADLMLMRTLPNGQKVPLRMDNPEDQEIMKKFATNSVRAGATGIGAGMGYMGASTMHIGGGKPANWGGASWIGEARQDGIQSGPVDLEAWKKSQITQTSKVTSNITPEIRQQIFETSPNPFSKAVMQNRINQTASIDMESSRGKAFSNIYTPPTGTQPEIRPNVLGLGLRKHQQTINNDAQQTERENAKGKALAAMSEEKEVNDKKVTHKETIRESVKNNNKDEKEEKTEKKPSTASPTRDQLKEYFEDGTTGV